MCKNRGILHYGEEYLSRSQKMNAAAPEGTPPRRISNNILCNLFALTCLGEALRRVTILKNTTKIGLRCQYPIRFLRGPVAQKTCR